MIWQLYRKKIALVLGRNGSLEANFLKHARTVHFLGDIEWGGLAEIAIEKITGDVFFVHLARQDAFVDDMLYYAQ